jgi:hypothetical protein
MIDMNLPGTSTSPFDPTPPDVNDPFSSTGPWAGPPETWQQLEASDDGRKQALNLGARHGELLGRIQALADANGGGLSGAAKGMMHRLEAAQLLTAYDRERLTALLEFMRTVGGSGTDPSAAMSRLQELHDAIVDDPASKPLALAVAAVALNSVTSRQATFSAPPDVNSYAAGFADAVGFAFGGFGGPLTALSLGVTASGVAMNTHISISYG